MTPKSLLHHRKMESRWGRSWLAVGAIAALHVWISLAGASARAESSGLEAIACSPLQQALSLWARS
jgi:hypothetical protein